MIRQQYRCAGFSLIEVLVALVILGVGFMGLARLQLALLAGTADSVAYDYAIRLANDQIESLRFAQLSGAVPGSGADEQPLQGMTFVRSWSVNCGASPLCQVAVTVKWSEPRSNGAQDQRELALNAFLSSPTSAEQAWLVQSGPPTREILP
jgi:prepilin-type N-terminal cleavage/methylation domain-containing protein